MKHILLVLFITLMLCIARLVWLQAYPADEVRIYVPMEVDKSKTFVSPIRNVQDEYCKNYPCKG